MTWFEQANLLYINGNLLWFVAILIDIKFKFI